MLITSLSSSLYRSAIGLNPDTFGSAPNHHSASLPLNLASLGAASVRSSHQLHSWRSLGRRRTPTSIGSFPSFYLLVRIFISILKDTCAPSVFD